MSVVPPSAGALLIFVQQLAHLLDRQRRAVLAERLLAFALIQEWPAALQIRRRRSSCYRPVTSRTDEAPVPSSTANVFTRCARSCMVEAISPSRK